MSVGLIASRYATALLRLVDQTGRGEAVCAQASSVEAALAAGTDSLRKTLDGMVLEDDLARFIALVIKNGRVSILRLILHTFVDMYYRERRIRFGRLTAVREPPQALIDEVRALVKARTGYDVIITTAVDPSLIGGFIFDIDDYMIDASVSRQLDRIRRQFIEKNRRIV